MTMRVTGCSARQSRLLRRLRRRGEGREEVNADVEDADAGEVVGVSWVALSFRAAFVGVVACCWDAILASSGLHCSKVSCTILSKSGRARRDAC